MAENWKEPLDDDGLTLGPEEALEREIARSKALKVERLQLRDRVEKLETRVQSLENKKAALEAQLEQNSNGFPQAAPPPHSQKPPSFPAGWTLFLWIFNMIALGFLTYFLGRS
jgi:hypothetical protein